MYASEQQLFEAEKSRAEDSGKKGCLYYDLKDAAVQLFHIEFKDTVVSEEKRVRYHGWLVRHYEKSQDHCGSVKCDDRADS